MRIIPKKIKVKNTVWKCYSMADVIVALVVLAIIFVAITSGSYAFAVIMGLIAVVMFMPTQDGIFYSCILENIKFLFAKKVYTENASKAKERVDAIIDLKDIKENGLIEYGGRKRCWACQTAGPSTVWTVSVFSAPLSPLKVRVAVPGSSVSRSTALYISP